ncbi:hypothetical protein FV767_24560 [Vibrio parahaemolyticus]|nr:hypothetical protein [Vibrio parahaemolyticus]
MNIVKPKAGDILLSATKEWTSLTIRVGTLSRWSHTGIVFSEKYLLEAVPKYGVKFTRISEFIEKNNDVLLVSRKSPLTKEQEEKLIKAVKLHYRKPYSLPLCLNSWLNKVGFLCWLGVFCYLFGKLYQTGFEDYVILTCFVLMLVPLGMLWVASTPVLSCKTIDKLCLPKKWKLSLQSFFCSHLVLEMDKAIGGNIDKNYGLLGQPRPCDIHEAAKKGPYTQHQLL